jgi:acetamidase/formamidase
MLEHSLGYEAIHHRWNAALPPALTVRTGDTVHFRCRDSSDGQITPQSTLADFVRADRERIHALTGPVFIEDAQPGDVLQIDILEVKHGGWGWTSIFPGWGLLEERFREPYLFIWKLEDDFSMSLAPARVPLRPFCGIMGVAPEQDGEFRTRPPGPFGGNLDVRDLVAGATLYLPVFRDGALFSTGDVHAAQGDGEVCINGIETPAEVTLRFTVRRDFQLEAPMAETPAGSAASGESGEWLMIEARENPLEAAAAATSRMVDFIADGWGVTPENAYVLCSATMSLRLSQVVNRPMVTVTAALPKGILPMIRSRPLH